MFDFLKRRNKALQLHRFKNLSIELPADWIFEMEEGEQQACYDPKSQSTLRINILKARHRDDFRADRDSLTGGLPYVLTTKGLLLVDATYLDTTERGHKITLVTWRMINDSADENLIAVLTYTVMTAELGTAKETEIIDMLKSSLQNAELS